MGVQHLLYRKIKDFLFHGHMTNLLRFMTLKLNKRYTQLMVRTAVNFFLVSHLHIFILDYIYSMLITEDNRFIITGGNDSVRVYDLKTKQELYHYGDFDGGILLNPILCSISIQGSIIKLFMCSKEKTVVCGTDNGVIKLLPLSEITDKLRFCKI